MQQLSTYFGKGLAGGYLGKGLAVGLLALVLTIGAQTGCDDFAPSQAPPAALASSPDSGLELGCERSGWDAVYEEMEDITRVEG